MELRAALEAARAIEGPLVVVSDSTYVVNCFRDRWWEGWLERGWTNKAKKPVANRDLWEPLIEEVRADPGRVTFRWVKGHSNDPSNDLVDRLAVEAARTQSGRSGEAPPGRLGPADAPGPGGQSDLDVGAPPGHWIPGVPPGHCIAVTGHKPPDLGGYGANPVAEAVRTSLAEVLTAKRVLQPDLVVLTGLGLGAEQLAAEAATQAGVPYVAVLAYPDPDSLWPADARRRFAVLVSGALSAIVLQTTPPATKALAGAALRRRDAWIGRSAAEAVVVWDGVEPGMGRAVRALQDSLGEAEVWVVTPPRTG